ncbi:MAG TPA: WHG domain-containing protein [Amycolatopsis sp.]|nr:WHG domain-containing protein [Amycolatopsis sp.]
MDSRTRLITTAATLLAREGVEAVTLRRIARAAGVSHGAPLRHFSGRAELLTAVATEGFAELRERAGELPGADPLQRLRTACRRYLEFALGNPAMFELMFRRDLTDPDEMGKLHEEVLQRFTDLVTRAQSGGWRAGEDTRALAASLWAASHGLAALRPPEADAALEVMLNAYLG